MPWWPDIAKRTLHFASAHQIHCAYRSANSVQNRAHRVRIHRGVAVDACVALLRRDFLKRGQQLGTVRTQNHLARGDRRCLFAHEIEQPAGTQMVIDHAHAIGALWVMRTHLVLS